MKSVYQRLAENFYRWEKRGRGELIHEWPVELEPPFIPFPGHRLPLEGPRDDGVRPTFLSKLTDTLFNAIKQPKEHLSSAPEPEFQEPGPNWFGEEDELPVEFRVALPATASPYAEQMAHFLKTLSSMHAPLAFEVIGTNAEISVQVTARAEDAALLHQQLVANFPEAGLSCSQQALATAWNDDGN